MFRFSPKFAKQTFASISNINGNRLLHIHSLVIYLNASLGPSPLPPEARGSRDGGLGAKSPAAGGKRLTDFED